MQRRSPPIAVVTFIGDGMEASGLAALLTGAGLEVERVEYVVLTPGPLRVRFPSTSDRIAGDARLGPLFGAQLVVAARKPSDNTLG